MGDCIHAFVQRSGGLQRSECFACLRARLEETEREREALFIEEREMYQKWSAACDRAEAAERERDAWGAKATADMAALNHRAEAAEVALEKAREEMRDTMDRVSAMMKAHGCDALCVSTDHSCRPAPAEPLRTPKERIATVLEEMAQRTRDTNAWLDRAEAELPERLCLGPCAKCDAEQAAEPLRTEGAPNLDRRRDEFDCECGRKYEVLSTGLALVYSLPRETEGAPKQEEPDLTPWCECGDMIDARNAGRCGNCLPGLESKAADADALRAQVERLEKALKKAIGVIGVAQRYSESMAKGYSIPDWNKAAECFGFDAETLRAALAPEAPVEKET